MIKKNKLVRTLVIFIVISIFIQVMFFFFLSEDGLSAIYPRVIKSKSRTVETGNASSIEYYGITEDIKSADILALNINLDVNLSYEALFDYLNFVCQNRVIKCIALPLTPIYISIGNSCITAGNSNDFNKYLENFKKSYAVSEQFCEFIKKVYKLNTSLPMNSQVRFISTNVDIKSTISNMVMSSFVDISGGVPEELSGLINGDPEICFKYIETNPEELSSFLGDNYDKFVEMSQYYYDGILKDKLLLDKIYNSSEDKITLFVSENIDSVLTLPGELNVFKVNTEYYNCCYDKDEGTIDLNTISISGVENPEIRFISSSDISSFVNFYDFISSPFARKNTENKDLNFFIICNSKGLTYFESD